MTAAGSGPGPVDHGAALRTEGDRLVTAVRGADLDARVPGLDWDVRTVATHTGAVHRWAADVVRRRLPTNETGGSTAFWPDGLDDADLAGWLADGVAELVRTLADAPADLACFTFVGGVAPRTFWRRRQAHETAVHRADVEATGPEGVTPLAAAFAQDGLAELVGAFATEAGFAASRPGVLLLCPDDGPADNAGAFSERCCRHYVQPPLASLSRCRCTASARPAATRLAAVWPPKPDRGWLRNQ